MIFLKHFFYSCFILISTYSHAQKNKYASDTLLNQVIIDSLFIEYKYAELESFSFFEHKKTDTTYSKFIKYEYEKLSSPESQKIIENLRISGIDDPERYYLRMSRKVQLFKLIYQKYPGLKNYSIQILGELLLNEHKESRNKSTQN